MPALTSMLVVKSTLPPACSSLAGVEKASTLKRSESRWNGPSVPATALAAAVPNSAARATSAIESRASLSLTMEHHPFAHGLAGLSYFKREAQRAALGQLGPRLLGELQRQAHRAGFGGIPARLGDGGVATVELALQHGADPA